MMGLFDRFRKLKTAPQPESLDIRRAFEANLKYISAMEKDAAAINSQFQKTMTRYCLTAGIADIPTGKVIVCDPLAYLPSGRFCPVLDLQAAPGSYPVEVSICRSPDIGVRMCTARLKIKNTPAIRYEPAIPEEDSAAARGRDGVLSGFPVDAGMICICDVQTAKEYQEFLDRWYEQNPDGNHYDDYFASFFRDSAEKLPQYQRQDGDFMEWRNPVSGNRMVMIASGFGDGFYQSWWGYDADDEITDLIVPLVNPDLFGI